MRHFFFVTVIGPLFAIALSGCTRAVVKSNKTNADILDQSGRWNTAFHEHDMPALMKLFSNDAQLATAGGKWKSKDEGLLRFASLLAKRPDLRWVIHPKDVVINEAWEVAFETGDWTEWWSEPDGKATIYGTYFFMWKKTLGEPWLIHAAIFTPLRCEGAPYCQPHAQ